MIPEPSSFGPNIDPKRVTPVGEIGLAGRLESLLFQDDVNGGTLYVHICTPVDTSDPKLFDAIFTAVREAGDQGKGPRLGNNQPFSSVYRSRKSSANPVLISKNKNSSSESPNLPMLNQDGKIVMRKPQKMWGTFPTLGLYRAEAGNLMLGWNIDNDHMWHVPLDYDGKPPPALPDLPKPPLVSR